MRARGGWIAVVIVIVIQTDLPVNNNHPKSGN